jgi:hypothetical protein
MLPYIAEEKKKTKAWWMDGWIDSWRGWMGAAGRMETLLNIGRGGSKTKDSGCFSKCLSTQPWMGSSEADALQ